MTLGRDALVAGLALAALVAGAAVAADGDPPADAQLSLNTASGSFTVDRLLPGEELTRCLRVRNEGAEPVPVLGSATLSGALAPYLRLVVERGTGLGDGGPSCAGFAPDGVHTFGTSAGGTAPSSLATEYVAAWPAQAERSYRITLQLPVSTGVGAMGRQARATFRWQGNPVLPEPSPPSGGDAGGGSAGGGTTGGGAPAVPAPPPPGGRAPGPPAGGDAARPWEEPGARLADEEVKRRFRIGRRIVRSDGTVMLVLRIPRGGAVRAKLTLPAAAARLYSHRLYPRARAGDLLVVLRPRPAAARVLRARHSAGRRLTATLGIRYRWSPRQTSTLLATRHVGLARPRR